MKVRASLFSFGWNEHAALLILPPQLMKVNSPSPFSFMALDSYQGEGVKDR